MKKTSSSFSWWSSGLCGPSWTEAPEHVMLADLLELVSGKQYLERHMSVTTSKDEHAPAHAGTLY